MPKSISITHTFSPSILRKYDIRGIVNDDLNKEDGYALGLAFVRYLIMEKLTPTIAVIKDARSSGVELKSEVIRGITDGGGTVYDCGIGTSPLCYFASHHLNTSGFIAITGSHNPAKYNGFKFGITGKAFSEEKILEVTNLAQNLEITGGGNIVECFDVKHEYIKRILQSIKLPKNIKFGFNALNGSSGVILPELAKHLDIPIFECEMNGSLNTVLDPSNKQNIERMMKDLTKHNLDIIFAFDGDADRIMAITKEKVLYGGDILFLCVQEVCSSTQNGKIIFDVKCSNSLLSEIKKRGGIPIMHKTGHSLIKEKMIEENAVLAGEGSGHIYFKHGYYGFDDGIYTAMRLISHFAQTNVTVTQIVESLPKVINSGDIKVPSKEKFAIVKKLQEIMENKGYVFNNIDGIRSEVPNLNSPSTWFLVRASNTEEILIVIYESANHDDFALVSKFVKSLLYEVGIELKQE